MHPLKALLNGDRSLLNASIKGIAECLLRVSSLLNASIKGIAECGLFRYLYFTNRRVICNIQVCCVYTGIIAAEQYDPI